MNKRPRYQGRNLRDLRDLRSATRRAALVLALAVVGVTGCSGTPPAAPTAAPSVPTPMATSVQTSDGTWATIPMGRLDEPLNTFWQLLFEPAGAPSWSNQVEATATATNGGLVLASFGGRSLIVGVRPSVDLTFTPLISTSDAARSWADGLVTETLAARPDALAATASGHALALVDKTGRAQVQTSTGDLSVWRTLITEHTLATGAGRSCGLGALTAVGYLNGKAVVGASCANPGVVGMFAQKAGTWSLVGPDLRGSVGRGRVEVLALAQTEAGADALLAVVRGNVTDLVASWSGPGRRWATSYPLPLRKGEQVASFGPAEGSGLFALLHLPSGRDQLAVATGPESAWRDWPSPPAGTATVAFGAAPPADALVADGTKLTIWSLRPGPGSWSPTQVIHVPIQYGSSS